MQRYHTMAVSAILLTALCLAGCGGPVEKGPPVGSPAWLWEAAVENHAAGDLSKTLEQLESILKEPENEYTQRAALWRAALLIGTARAHTEIADSYAAGVETSSALANELTVPVQEHQRIARQRLIDLTESMNKLLDIIGEGETIPVDFPFPTGSASPPGVFERIADGEAIPAATRATAEDRMMNRGLLLAATGMVGAGEQVNKAQGMFASAPVQVPRIELMHFFGESLFELSKLFDHSRLNQPQVRKVMLDVATNCLKPVLEAENEDLKKSAEEIQKEIEREQRRIKV